MRLVRIFTLLCLCFVYIASIAQSGCTDQLANNYMPGATSNNGSCTYDSTFLPTHLVGLINSYASESSGLVFTDGNMWTHEDSGNQPKIFKIDTGNGQLLQTVTITNYANNDWEDITADSAYIYIGDFGNNNGDRTDLRILKVLKAQIGSGTTANVTAEAINFSYTDQTSFNSNSNTNYNCEALISVGDSLYIFTKRGDLKTTCYKLPKTPGTYSISPYTTYNTKGKITGADLNPNTKMIALIGYEASDLNSFMYLLYDYRADSFFTGNVRRLQLGSAIKHWQTEAVEFVSDNEVFISCETAGGTNAGLYKAILPGTSTTTALWEVGPAHNNVLVYPNPSDQMFTIQTLLPFKQVEVYSIDGRQVAQLKYGAGVNKAVISNADISDMPGVYLLKISLENGECYQKVMLY